MLVASLAFDDDLPLAPLTDAARDVPMPSVAGLPSAWPPVVPDLAAYRDHAHVLRARAITDTLTAAGGRIRRRLQRLDRPMLDGPLLDNVNYWIEHPAMTKAGDIEQRSTAVRRFNRFYTRQIGVLRKTYLDSPYSLGEMRVLYEIGRGDGPTASDIGRELDLDAGYLSRVLRNFEKRGLISRTTSAKDARQSHLALTAKGRKTFAQAEKRSQNDIRNMLGKLGPDDQARLVKAMETIETLLGGKTEPRNRTVILREPRRGDLGWMVSRHAELYAQEYNWTEPFEGLCAQIVADFANNFDPKRERCWIAELDGENVGSIMLVKDSPEVARIRLLLVDPKARGLGLATRLVDECIKFARQAGYKKITLWTHSVLTAARHVYEKAGFTLTASEPRHSWGEDVVAEFWDLEL